MWNGHQPSRCQCRQPSVSSLGHLPTDKNVRVRSHVLDNGSRCRNGKGQDVLHNNWEEEGGKEGRRGGACKTICTSETGRFDPRSDTLGSRPSSSRPACPLLLEPSARQREQVPHQQMRLRERPQQPKGCRSRAGPGVARIMLDNQVSHPLTIGQGRNMWPDLLHGTGTTRLKRRRLSSFALHMSQARRRNAWAASPLSCPT